MCRVSRRALTAKWRLRGFDGEASWWTTYNRRGVGILRRMRRCRTGVHVGGLVGVGCGVAGIIWTRVCGAIFTTLFGVRSTGRGVCDATGTIWTHVGGVLGVVQGLEGITWQRHIRL